MRFAGHIVTSGAGCFEGFEHWREGLSELQKFVPGSVHRFVEPWDIVGQVVEGIVVVLTFVVGWAFLEVGTVQSGGWPADLKPVVGRTEVLGNSTDFPSFPLNCSSWILQSGDWRVEGEQRIVDEGVFEKLYFVDDEEGYTHYLNLSTKEAFVLRLHTFAGGQVLVLFRSGFAGLLVHFVLRGCECQESCP